MIEKAKKTVQKKNLSTSQLAGEYLKRLSSENDDSIVFNIVKNAPVKKTRQGTEKKILKKNLLRKYYSC